MTARRLWLGWWLFYAAWALLLVAPIDIFPRAAVRTKVNGLSLSKVLHMACYATLAIGALLLPLKKHPRWLMLLVVSTHGFATEALQLFTETRTGCLSDVGFDHVGMSIGAIVAGAWLALVRRSQRRTAGPVADAPGSDGENPRPG